MPAASGHVVDDNGWRSWQVLGHVTGEHREYASYPPPGVLLVMITMSRFWRAGSPVCPWAVNAKSALTATIEARRCAPRVKHARPPVVETHSRRFASASHLVKFSRNQTARRMFQVRTKCGRDERGLQTRKEHPMKHATAVLLASAMTFAASSGVMAQSSNANDEPACNAPGMGA